MTKKEKEYVRSIEKVLAPRGVAVLKYVYDRKAFGNMILRTIDSNGMVREYILDRSAIYISCVRYSIRKVSGEGREPLGFKDVLGLVFEDLKNDQPRPFDSGQETKTGSRDMDFELLGCSLSLAIERAIAKRPMRERRIGRLIEEGLAPYVGVDVDGCSFGRKAFGNIVLKTVNRNGEVREYISNRSAVFVGSPLYTASKVLAEDRGCSGFENILGCVIRDLEDDGS